MVWLWLMNVSAIPNITECTTSLETVHNVVHDVFFEKKCTELEDKQCTTEHIPVIKDTTETRCVPAYRSKCRKVERSVNRPICTTMYESECTMVLVQLYTTSYEEECGSGGCHMVAKQVPSKQPRKKCSSVKKKKCKEVPIKEEEQKCHHIPTQDCVNVPVKVPISVPRQDCRPVPRKHCQRVPVRRPRLVIQTLPKENCWVKATNT